MSRLQINSSIFARITILSIAAIYLSACQPFINSFDRPDMTSLSPRLMPLFEQTKTVCFGRFVIDVPTTAIIVVGPSEAETSLHFYPHEAGSIANRVAKQLKLVESDRKFLSEKDKVRLPLFGTVIEGAAPGQKLIFGSKDRAGYSMHSFFPVGEHLYVQELDGGVLDEADVDDAKRFFNAIATSLRLRTDDEIPEEPGMCVEGGFIPMDMQYERVRLGVRLKEFPDVHFSVEAHKNQEFIPEASDLETLLDRAEKNAQIAGLGMHYARIKTFRRGPRELGVWEGYEILARKPPFKKDTDAHEFRFRSVGAVNDAYHPELDVQLDSGVNGNSKAAIKPSITDEEAVALWDKLIKSIRVRAPADSKARSNIRPNVPLGRVTTTGETCPVSGWWECNAGGAIEGASRKRISAGETMPHVVRLGAPSLWQKLTGDQPRHKISTTWSLKEYDEAITPPAIDHA